VCPFLSWAAGWKFCGCFRWSGQLATAPHRAQHPQIVQLQSDGLLTRRRTLAHLQRADERRGQRRHGPGSALRGRRTGPAHAQGQEDRLQQPLEGTTQINTFTSCLDCALPKDTSLNF